MKVEHVGEASSRSSAGRSMLRPCGRARKLLILLRGILRSGGLCAGDYLGYVVEVACAYETSLLCGAIAVFFGGFCAALLKFRVGFHARVQEFPRQIEHGH